jgi:CDP-paratose 2-epimerase
MTRILITGGAGFVGSALAIRLRTSRPSASIVALDNLHRRGSELTLSRLASAGVSFVHGDIRHRDDVDAAGPFDVMIECSAEPSVHAGSDGDPGYVVGTNLWGTTVCLEAARRNRAAVLFLSTSRVYSIAALRALPLQPSGTRLVLRAAVSGQGWSSRGITTDFSLKGHRSLYGATKLASELLIDEYREMYGMPAVVTRFGVIAGPWQFGKVDQGFVSLWAARHLWGEQLSYSGFGGEGLQVRDVLHVDDVADLVERQLDRLSALSGRTFNAGGGPERSLSLRELTAACASRTGRALAVEPVPATAAADIPYYVSDNAEITAETGWSPRRSVDVLLDDVFAWLRAEEPALKPLFGQRSVSARCP